MRETLAALAGRRLVVLATVRHLSTRTGWGLVREPTILLGDLVTEAGAPLADHLWLPLGKRLARLDPRPGDVLQFSARVAPYRRGLKRLPGEPTQFTVEYGLVYPTRCEVVGRAPKRVPPPAPLPRPAPLPKPPAPPLLPTRTRLLAALGALWAEQPEPPSLSHLFAQAGVGPVAFLKQVQKLARSGAVVLSPDGHLCPPTVSEGSTRP